MRGQKVLDKFRHDKPAKGQTRPANEPAASVSGGTEAPSTASNGQGHPFASPVKPIKLEAYYDSARNCYWIANNSGEWMKIPEAALSRRLRMQGFSKLGYLSNGLTEVEDAITRLQNDHEIMWAGQLAGYKPGLHRICGQRILITRGPQLPQPARGTWPTLKKFFTELLKENVHWFYGWTKCARQALASGPPWRPGHALALAGPPDCGKNLLQGLITEILGGRAAKPYRYLIDKTTFNADLLAAEHLMIQDENASRDMRSRRALGANLKNLVANEVQSFHPKGKDAISVTPFWRITISLNEDPEDLLVLPPLERSIAEKIILLKCFPATFPKSADEPVGRKAFRELLTKEMPAFLHWLKAWQIPDAMQSRRYGIKDFQEPSLVKDLDELSSDQQLWSRILASDVMPRDGTAWQGTANELERVLREFYRHGEIDNLLSWSNACGTYLGHLAKSMPDFVWQKGRKHNERIWHLKLPPAGENDEQEENPIPD